jgi:AcrR family transcriptional regulator
VAQDPILEARPTSRRRPKDRREQIVGSAAQLFWRLGYRRVSMADIGSSVGIGASALYRHFGSKAELLAAVLDGSLDALDIALSEIEGADADTHIEVGSEVVLVHRELAALWDRSNVDLSHSDRARLHARRGLVLTRLIGGVSVDAPDSLAAERRASAVIAVLESPSYHRVVLPAPDFAELLRGMARAVAAVPLPSATEPPARARASRQPVTRREALHAAASRLFAERGFPSVSLAELGAAAGIAGPTVYNHIANKGELLASILNRGMEVLWFRIHGALAVEECPRDTLVRLLDGHIDTLLTDPLMVSAWLTEVSSLPAEEYDRIQRSQHDYVLEWAALLREWRPELSEQRARVLLHGMFTVVNALARALPVRESPGLGAEISAIAFAVLRTPVG